jgi:hypothetical protein
MKELLPAVCRYFEDDGSKGAEAGDVPGKTDYASQE